MAISTRTVQVVSVVAATVVALACGTNYVYSAWAPQFAAKLNLSSTQINLIGTAGNIGMYGAGIPVGILVDAKGPRPAVLLGAVTLGLGYFLINRAYVSGPPPTSVFLLCLYTLLTGIGSCSAFYAAIKIPALNWPDHRGTATAFPMAGFGLSAFFFSALAAMAFPDNTSKFLLVLAVGTFSMVSASLFFLRVVKHSAVYSALPTQEDHSQPTSRQSERPKSIIQRRGAGSIKEHKTELDIRGMALLPKLEFWILFVLLGTLTGIGLMTINNIGNDTRALWNHFDDTVPSDYIEKRQHFHVSIISITSFGGRLASGMGSDLIQLKLRMSRYWCLVLASAVFAAAQLCAIRIENPHYLWAVSGLSGR
ncbi:MAG: hypothetical protein M1823_001511 [Watsoniomyces obsoletus]|nr:MAG: hypothetical protein M1823_001511 [Watsoniomyces obsoletus]